MNNCRLSCLPWLPKQGRQVLLSGILCLFVFGLSAFSLTPSARAASVPAKTVSFSRVQQTSSGWQKTTVSIVQLSSGWQNWSWDEFDQPCFGVGINCPGLSIHLHADGTRNPSIQQIWQWHVTCTASGYQVLGYALCTWHGYFHNGTRVIQVGVDGTICSNIAVVEGVCDSDVGIRTSIDAYGGIISDYQWAH
jgi:hypothetical protein